MTALHGVCGLWQCGSVGARLLTNLLCCTLLPCKHYCAVVVTLRHTDILRTSLGWRKKEKRREKLASASSEKLAGKSQAGLGFGASGVLVTVLEAQP